MRMSSMLVRYYTVKPPLIRESRLTTRERGGVGKELSTGWVTNFAIGCTHACPFCYVDSIHKRLIVRIHPEAGLEWGTYLLIPEPASFKKALEATPWGKWRGEVVLMSSTHDPFLPQLLPYAQAILEAGLSHGVNFLIQTRSLNVLRLLPLLARYRRQVTLQVSIATLNEGLRRVIEPNVPPGEARLMVLKRAGGLGVRTGVIIAPILPPVRVRPDVEGDLHAIMSGLASAHVGRVFGELLHVRGWNIERLSRLLGEPVRVGRIIDEWVEGAFHRECKIFGLDCVYWREY